MVRRLLLPALFVSCGLGLLVWLGVWQIHRLAWKEGLIAAVAARVDRPAEPLPPEAAWDRLKPEDYEFRRVRLSGRYLNDREVYAFTSLSEPKGPFRGPGYWVFTPLRLADGALVFVNRGFVPMDRKDPSTRAAGETDGTVEITGLMRSPDHPSFFTPTPDPARKVFFLRDPAAMARAIGKPLGADARDGCAQSESEQGLVSAAAKPCAALDRIAPFYVDAAETAPGGLPQGGETRLSFPNPHLGYALTWFGLAATLLITFLAWAWQQIAQPLGGQRGVR